MKLPRESNGVYWESEFEVKIFIFIIDADMSKQNKTK